jgi:uncharacterized UPF0160 family protein
MEETLVPEKSNGKMPEGTMPLPSAFEDLNKIRDILFGSQSQQISEHLNRLEKRLLEETDALRNALEAQVTRLENDVLERLADVRESLKAESEERQAADTELLAALTQKIDALTQDMQAQFQKHTEHLESEAETRTNSVKDQQKQLQTLDKNVQEARVADKKAMANLLVEMANALQKG